MAIDNSTTHLTKPRLFRQNFLTFFKRKTVKKESSALRKNFGLLILIIGFGPILPLLLVAGTGALFNSKARQWLQQQPGYLYHISYLPGMGLTTKRRMIAGMLLYFALPITVFYGIVFTFLYAIIFEELFGLILLISSPLSLVSMSVAYAWLTGKVGFFYAEIVAAESDRGAVSFSGSTPAARTANLRKFLGFSNLSRLTEHAQRSAVFSTTIKKLPRFVWWLVLIIAVPFSIITYLSAGWLFALAGMVLCFVPPYRRWFQRQSGVINRLGFFRGWRAKNPFVLAFVHFYYFGLWSILFSVWALVSLDEVFDLFFFGLLLTPFMGPLLFGWLIRSWDLPFPGLNLLMKLNGGFRKWRRQMNMAVTLRSQESYREAIAVLLESEAFCAERFGPNHFTRSMVFTALGRLYLQIGQYHQSIDAYTQSLEISEIGFGKVSKQAANSHYRLGKLQVHLGHYTKAIPHFKSCIQTFHLLGGKTNPSYAKAYDDLGYAYLNLNHLEIAQALFEEAEDMQNGRFMADWTETVNHLALLFTTQNDFETSNQYFERLEQVMIDVPQRVKSWIWFNRATYYRKLHQYEEALMWQEKALKNEQSLYYDTHLTVGKYKKQLADIYFDLGDYKKALSYYIDARGIYYLHNELIHPEFLDCLFGLGKLYAAMGEYDLAYLEMKFALDQDEKIVGRILAFGSENGRLSFIRTKHERMILFLELIRQFLSTNDEALDAASVILRRQSLTADLSSAAKLLKSSDDHQTKKLIMQLDALNKEIGYFEADGARLDEAQAVFNRKKIEKYAERERLETEISQRLPFDQILEKINETTWQAVSNSLPPNSVLLQIVYGAQYDFTAVSSLNQPSWGQPRYSVYLLNAGEKRPAFFDLGPGDPIEEAIKGLRKAVDTMRKSGGTKPPEEMLVEYSRIGQQLLQRVITPLATSIEGKEHLFIVPDGLFSSLPFEILPVDQQEYMLDRYQISYLSAARDLLRNYEAIAQSAPLVVANPDYNLFKNKINQSGEVTTRTAEIDQADTRTAFGGEHDDDQIDELLEAAPFLSRDIHHRGAVYFSDLANTHEEGEEIAHLLEVEPKLKAEANEYQIKNCHSPKVLHIATHGFFLEQKDDIQKDTNNRLLQIQKNQNPLVRSGLALAGANEWLRDAKQKNYQENGILNGLDVASLDLTGTCLVVLSACDTGLGDFVDGEGVFGLRRAFVMAGAHTLVMSMWKVPDAQTKQLMIEFYQELLQGTPRAQALRKAQLSIKNRSETAHPFFWGAFICQGEYDTLD